MSAIGEQEARPPRLVGFDLIRLVSFWAVTCYHFIYAVWFGRLPQYNAVMSTNVVYQGLLLPALRILSFSGHIIFFLTALLLAMTRKSLKSQLRFWCFLFLAWALFVWADGGFSRFDPSWDIHLLILTTLIVMMVAEHRQGLVLILGGIGFVMTFIPFWQFAIFAPIPLVIRHALIGDCESGLSSWPLLPWSGLFFLGYAVGFVLRSPSTRKKFSSVSRFELAAWIAVMLISSFNLGGYYQIHTTEDWECLVFRQPPLTFWSHFIFVVFLMRLSLLKVVNERLRRAWPGLEKLNISKNFFLAYALQYVLGFIIALCFSDVLQRSATAFTLFMVLMLPAAEFLAWIAAKLGARRLIKGSAQP